MQVLREIACALCKIVGSGLTELSHVVHGMPVTLSSTRVPRIPRIMAPAPLNTSQDNL